MTSTQTAAMRHAAVLASALALGACGGPALYEPLQTTESRFATARSDPMLQKNAPVELREAEEALQAAENARRGSDRPELVHYTYMANKRLDLAQAQAQRRHADERVEALSDERDQILIQARSREATRIQQGTVLTLGDVLFESGQATLLPGAALKLDPLVEYMRSHPNSSLVIEGHTDSIGSSGYNQQLSQARADAVRNYLTAQGIPMERMIARGMGEDFPLASNETAAGRQQNRRVEVLVQGA
jgi:outer membrane protein OmpA-like peptidoglycan-associated protein